MHASFLVKIPLLLAQVILQRPHRDLFTLESRTPTHPGSFSGHGPFVTEPSRLSSGLYPGVRERDGGQAKDPAGSSNGRWYTNTPLYHDNISRPFRYIHNSNVIIIPPTAAGKRA